MFEIEEVKRERRRSVTKAVNDATDLFLNRGAGSIRGNKYKFTENYLRSLKS